MQSHTNKVKLGYPELYNEKHTLQILSSPKQSWLSTYSTPKKNDWLF